MYLAICRAVGVHLLVMVIVGGALSQTREYPKEIRGYKVERAVVEVKRADAKERKSTGDKSQAPQQNSPNANEPNNNQARSEGDTLIQLGKPQLGRVTPLGVTFEVPIVVAPVKHSGHVDFLLFEAMVLNGTSVDIDEYHRAFDLPNKQPLMLREPLSIYIHLPSAVLAAVDEWSNSKETWPVTGLVYVCGSFKKSILSFKRCVPVEINTTMGNPLQSRERSDRIIYHSSFDIFHLPFENVSWHLRVWNGEWSTTRMAGKSASRVGLIHHASDRTQYHNLGSRLLSQIIDKLIDL